MQQGKTSISLLFSNMKALWDELDDLDPLLVCTCGANFSCTLTKKMLKTQQDQRLMVFLIKLNEDYIQAKAKILMMQPLPNLSIACRLLVQEERHQEVSNAVATHETMAFAAYDRRRQYDKTAQRNQSIYKPQSHPPLSGNKRSFSWFCNYCNKLGYDINCCYELHGLPPHLNGHETRKLSILLKQTLNLILMILSTHKLKPYLLNNIIN